MNFTRTKIITSIGPKTRDIQSIKALHKAGMNVVRINMSHASHKELSETVKLVKKINKDQHTKFGPIGILVDTQGPEIRTGESDEKLDLKVGDIINLTVRDNADVETSSIKINYSGMILSVKKGSKITIDNGLINFIVLSKNKHSLKCRVVDGGKLGSKRHVNLPGVRVDLPSITKKDKKDINFALKEGVDFIALSFVRSESDVKELRKILDKKKSSVKIISKIENQEGLDNIHEITKASDLVMVARGDLGIETDLADLPNIQRRIMYSTAKNGKRSIVATHLLESMIENPTPTRAEVTDVANAIYEGADAVMLSGETTVGNYPLKCVEMLKRIALKTEEFRTLGYERFLKSDSDWQNIALAARDLATSIEANGIVVITRSGETANVVSNTKPFRMPVFAFTDNDVTYNQLSLVGGMQPNRIPSLRTQSSAISLVKKILVEKYKMKKGFKFVLLAGVFSASHSDSLQIIKI